MGSAFRGEERPATTSGASVPKDMADRILSSRSSLQGERKQVTVLFADVAGFTQLSEKLDPEEVHDLIRPALDIMADEIHAYEGTVSQFTGDGLMALFGAPLAHEDDPQRAIYAALAMQPRLQEYGEKLKPRGLELTMRIGINTGLVMVGSVGDDLAMEYTALGDTVNLASRMESSAEPGTVQVSESTHQLTQGYFEFHDLGEMEVKGKEKPVHAWRVLRALPTKGRIAASLARGLSPFVGRERELDNLNYSYLQTKGGQGQVVGIVGEPGVGKSRLLLQFRESLPQDECTYLEGGCIHYGEAIAYLPILRVLRNYFDIGEGEVEIESKRKMEERLSSLDGQLSHILPPLQELLSLSVDDDTYLSLEPAQRRERVFEAVRYLLIAESQKKPLVLAIEDLQWMDRTSEEFLSSLIDSIPGTAILLLLLYRPDYTPAWSSKTYYRQMLVDQLSDEPSTKLVDAILSEGEVSYEIREFIVTKTAGNPLFIEEMTRALLEAESITKDNEHYVLSGEPSDIQVPDTIQGIIASRLDRLSKELKETIQVASVIGREFSLRLLEEVISTGNPIKPLLMQLQSLEFIYEKALFPEPEYIFKHTLTQEVAYNSLLLKRRKEMHWKIGQATERLHPDSLEDFYETLAYHYPRSEDNENAIAYLKLSADKSAKNYSPWEAVRLYQEAINILDAQPESEERNESKLEVCLAIQNPLLMLSYPEESLEILHEAERLAEELKDKRSLATVYPLCARYYSAIGNILMGIEYSKKCIDVAEKMGDIDSMARAAFDACNSLFHAGNILEVAAISRRVLEVLEKKQKEESLLMGSWSTYSGLCGWRGNTLFLLGEFEEAEAVFDKGVRISLEMGDLFGVAFVEFNRCDCFFYSGDSRIIEHANKTIGIFEETGIETILGAALSFLGFGYYFLGDYEKARDYTKEGLKRQLQSGLPVLLPWENHISSLALLAAGDLEDARTHAEEAVRLSQEYKTRVYEGPGWIALGRIVGEDDPSSIDLAERHIRKGISIAEEIHFKSQVSIGYLFLGEVFEITGRREEALENLRKAEEMYLEMGVAPDSYWLARTREALARLESVS